MEEELVLREPAQFKALGHPLRHRLLIALRQRPATLAQLGAAAGCAKGTAAFHIRVLQEAGLVRPAHSRTVRGGTEQYYEPTTARLRIAPDAPVGGEFLVRTALSQMQPSEPGDSSHTLLRHVRLTREQAGQLASQLEDLAAGLPTSPDGDPHGVLLSIYRADVPVLPPDADMPLK